MKTFALITVVLFAGFSLRAQTNGAPSSTAGVKNEETAKAKVSAPGAGSSTNSAGVKKAVRPVSAAPLQKMPANNEVRSQNDSKAIQNLTESLAAQTPRSSEANSHRTYGVFPSFIRSVKTGSNPFQLINPFAPVPKEEGDPLAAHTHVSYEPATQTGPALDIFSVDF